MSAKFKKLLAYKYKIQNAIIYAVFFILAVPLIILCIGLHLNNNDLDASLIFSLKWSAIILPCLLVICLLYAFYFSAYLVITDKAVIFHKSIFTKNEESIDLCNITECIISDGRFEQNGKLVKGHKIFIYVNNLAHIYQCNSMIILNLINRLGSENVKLVDYELEVNEANGFTEKYLLKTFSEYYNVDFDTLTNEQQKILCMHYCKLTKNESHNGNEILLGKQKRHNSN